jgi:hypothetical protein
LTPSVIGDNPFKAGPIQLVNFRVLVLEINTAPLVYWDQVGSYFMVDRPQSNPGLVIGLASNSIRLDCSLRAKSPKKGIKFHHNLRGSGENLFFEQIMIWTVVAVVTDRHRHPGFVESEYDTVLSNSLDR